MRLSMTFGDTVMIKDSQPPFFAEIIGITTWVEGEATYHIRGWDSQMRAVITHGNILAKELILVSAGE